MRRIGCLVSNWNSWSATFPPCDHLVRGQRSVTIRSGATQNIGVIVSEGDQAPVGGQPGDRGPFGEILDLGLPADMPPTVIPAAPPEGPAAPKSHRRSLIIGIVCVVVIAAVVVPAAFVFDAATAAISSGNGTATITWTSAPGSGDASSNPPQSFSGTINGHTLSGVATVAIPTGAANPFANSKGAPKNVQIFQYKGSFDGKPFDIGVFIHYPVSLGSTGSTTFTIDGTYDGQAVHATLGPPANPNLSNPPIPFSGTIGSWQVKGIIHGPNGTNGKQTATATFTVNS